MWALTLMEEMNYGYLITTLKLGEKMKYKKITLGTLAFFISSFGIQGLLGLALVGEYFESISIFRNPPIIHLAFTQTIITGIAFSILYPITNIGGTPVLSGLKFGFLIGIIVVPFVALDLPARFMIPSVGTWILVQGILGIIHYAIAGVLIGLIYGKDTNKE
jgi:hypothetical protein